MPLIKSGSKQALKEISLAYMAGFFDGEGCVNFTQSGYSKTWVVRVMVRNTDLGIIQSIQNTFGGRISTTLQKKRPAWKTSYCWIIVGGKAIDFLRLIDPFVIVKRDQILTAMFWDDIRNRIPCKPSSAEDKELVFLLVRQLQWLNRKGPRLEMDKEPIQEVLDTIPIEESRHAFN